MCTFMEAVSKNVIKIQMTVTKVCEVVVSMCKTGLSKPECLNCIYLAGRAV